MTYPDEAAREEAWQRAERDREWWREVPEPPELTAWAEQREAAKAEAERIGSVPCANCGQRRDWVGHKMVASRNRVLCRFVEATCPNEDDPILCSVHDGRFIPEAGCPVHDREPSGGDAA